MGMDRTRDSVEPRSSATSWLGILKARVGRSGLGPNASLSPILWRAIWVVSAAAVLACWAQGARRALSAPGLFWGVGNDYGLFLAQAMAFRSGDPSSIYDLNVLDQFHRLLA